MFIVTPQSSDWTSEKPMTFVFDALWSMGTGIKLFTTISPNFFWEIGKSQRTEILQKIETYTERERMPKAFFSKDPAQIIIYGRKAFSHMLEKINLRLFPPE